jgi:hypothetical protein
MIEIAYVDFGPHTIPVSPCMSPDVSHKDPGFVACLTPGGIPDAILVRKICARMRLRR